MNNNVANEWELDLKDLLYWVLNRWRKILVGAIVIAFLAGLYSVYSNLSVLLNDDKLAERQDKYEIELADFEATGERLKIRINNLRELSEHQQEYNEKSILMTIDPMDKWIGNLQIYIDSKYQINPNISYQNIDMTNRLVSAYASYLQSGEFYQEIISQTPQIDEIRFLTEVLSIKAEPSSATITINCVGASESDVKQLLESVKAKFTEQFRIVRSAIGDHSYDVLTESVYSTIDLYLEQTQKNNLEAIAQYANDIGETNNELTEWERKVVPKPKYGVWYTVKQTVKFIILGGASGIVFLCMWFVVKYAINNTIKTDDDWRAFQLPVLAHITRDVVKSKFLPGLDRLIDRLFGRNRKLTMDQSCVLSAQSLHAVLKERDLTTGNFVGCIADDQAETLVLKMNTVGTDISYRYAGDALTDPETARNLEGAKEVLIICERYVTSYSEINQLLTLLKAWGKDVLGVVVVE